MSICKIVYKKCITHIKNIDYLSKFASMILSQFHLFKSFYFYFYCSKCKLLRLLYTLNKYQKKTLRDGRQLRLKKKISRAQTTVYINHCSGSRKVASRMCWRVVEGPRWVGDPFRIGIHRRSVASKYIIVSVVKKGNKKKKYVPGPRDTSSRVPVVHRPVFRRR